MIKIQEDMNTYLVQNLSKGGGGPLIQIKAIRTILWTQATLLIEFNEIRSNWVKHEYAAKKEILFNELV